jgi:hypothetical protein
LRGGRRDGERAGEWWRIAGCSNVASGPTPAELLELVDAAIIALDAGKTDIARARLSVLADAVQSRVTGSGRNRV